jgi:hypothetical protein
VAFVQLLCQIEPHEPALSEWLLGALIGINPTHLDVAPVARGLMQTVGKLFGDRNTHDGRLFFHFNSSYVMQKSKQIFDTIFHLFGTKQTCTYLINS